MHGMGGGARALGLLLLAGACAHAPADAAAAPGAPARCTAAIDAVLAEPVGEGARNERRLVVSEGVFADADQYGLLALHLVDQAAAAAVFDDPLRLQWDALGDLGGALDAVLPPR